MFELQIAETGHNYKVADTFTDADEVIYKFLDIVDYHPSVRVMRADGTCMARRTPKSSFIAPEWRR